MEEKELAAADAATTEEPAAVAEDVTGTEALTEADKKAAKKAKVKQYFSAKKIATMAVMAALAFVISIFDFPLFPQASFLKLDFGNVFILLTGFLFGPIEGVIVCGIKEVIRISMSTTGGVGELANFLMATAYIIIPATVYKFRRRFWVVIPSLIAGVAAMTAMALVCNRYITFPLFMGKGAEGAFKSLWPFIIYFNLAKGAIISVLVCLMYKTLSKLLKMF